MTNRKTSLTIALIALSSLGVGCEKAPPQAKPEAPDAAAPAQPGAPTAAPYAAPEAPAPGQAPPGRAIGEGDCPQPGPAVLHCGVRGDSPALIDGHIQCCTYVCMKGLGALQEGSVWLLDAKGQQVEGAVSGDQGCVSFKAKEKLAPNARYELVMDRLFVRDQDGAPITINNAEESVGRHRFCFDSSEDVLGRNNPSDTVTGCAAERERQAQIPAILTDARYYDVQQRNIARVDEFADVRALIAEGLDLDTARPRAQASASKAPPAVSFTFKDAARAETGKATLDCDGWFCAWAPGKEAEATCLRAHNHWFNKSFSLRAALCKP